MEFEQVSVPAADPAALRAWYGSLFDLDATESVTDSTEPTPELELGETTLQFRPAADPPPAHLAVRLRVDAETAVDWLTEQATIIPVEGASSRWFEFLEATAIYFDDPESNVLEGLCYRGDPRRDTESEPVVDGVTEVGLPAHEPLALVEWLEETVGLSAWGTPSDTFAWVGDRHARFVVVPAGREWYPTDRPAGLAPISVTVVDESTTPGQYRHPTLPYVVRTVQDSETAQRYRDSR